MRIYKRNDNWYIDYIFKGRRHRKKIGKSKRMAELALKEVEVKIVKGEYLGIYEEKKILFEEFAKEYLNYSKANKSSTSYERDMTSLRIHLIPYLKDKYLFEITPQMIEEYKSERLKKIKPATVNRELSCLKHLYTKAIEWSYVKNNPVSKVKKLKEPPGRIRYLEPKEINALLANCAPHIKSIAICALNTGMRRGEILSLKWSNVDLRNKTIVLRETKNNELRIIPINDPLYETLKSLPQYFKRDYVFFNNKDGDRLKSIRSFEKAVARAGIEDFTFHDLRHTFASHLIMSGADIRTVQQLLGHKDIKMTMRYSHLSPSHLADAVHKVGTILAQTDFGKNRKACNS
jgi:integrase